MTYTPPTPPPPPAAVPMGQDRTTMWGWLGIIVGFFCCWLLGVIFGVLSIRDAQKFGNSKTLGYIAIVVSVVNLVGVTIWSFNR